MKVRNFFWPALFILLSYFLSISGCGLLVKEECVYKDLPEIKCSGSYSVVNGTAYYQLLNYNGSKPTNQVFIINSDSAYLAFFKGAPSGFGPPPGIDFNSKSILVTLVLTNKGSGLQSQGFLCYQTSQRTWKYTVQYSLRDQCAGSHISRMTLTASLVCMKLPQNTSIELEVVDINPF